MTSNEIVEILKHVKFQDWIFHVNVDREMHLYVEFKDQVGTPWKSRKWLVSSWATKSEVVQTAFKCILTALEHEAREEFTYKGRAIFGPHFDVERLHFMADGSNENRRPPHEKA